MIIFENEDYVSDKGLHLLKSLMSQPNQNGLIASHIHNYYYIQSKVYTVRIAKHTQLQPFVNTNIFDISMSNIGVDQTRAKNEIR